MPQAAGADCRLRVLLGVLDLPKEHEVNRATLDRGVRHFGTVLLRSLRDLLPIVAVVGAFQLLVIRQPLENVGELLIGLTFVVVGLSLFIIGLDMGLFPLGESMAHDFARRGSLPWLLTFAFALGFGTTVAEPALIAVADKAAGIATSDVPPDEHEAARDRFAIVLRLTVALSVGAALVLGVFRILKGWPIHFLIIGGYVLVMLLTLVAPREIVAIAYDSGGVTTSTITVPLATALGVGLANSIEGRNPLVDGFGLIAFASLLPMVFVLVLGIIW